MEWYLAVLLFAVSSVITPGPNNIMIMSSGLNFGIRRSIPHFLGILVGLSLMVASVGLGMASLFKAAPQLHPVIQIVGVIYLLYFAWLVATSEDIDTSCKKAISFTQAVVFQWVNPKAWVIATGAIAAFTTAESQIALQVTYIASAFALASIPCLGTWLFCGSFLSRHLKQPKFRQFFNRTMAGLLVISIVPIIVELAIEFFKVII